MKNILYTIILLLISTNLLADATQGEMFGLKLGDQYSSPNEPLDHYDVYSTLRYFVPDAIKPDNYGDVSIEVTKISRTIVKIISEICFEKYTESKNFYYKQILVINELYKNKQNLDIYTKLSHENKSYVEKSSENSEFQISIIIDRSDSLNCVAISLRPTNSNPLLNLAAKEELELVIKSQSTEGL